MDPPRPHWAHHNHSDQHINLIFTPFLWQPIIPSPPPSTTFDDDDDHNNHNNHTHAYHPPTRQHRSPPASPPPSTPNDSGYFTSPPSSSPRRPNRKYQPLTVVNPTPSPPQHSQTPLSIVEEHLESKSITNKNVIESTNRSQQRRLSWSSNDNDDDDDDEADIKEEMAHCAPTSTTDLVAKKPMSGKEDAGTGFLALRLRSGFDKGLRIVGKGVAIALGLGSAGRYGREGLGDEGGREGLGDERGREGLGDEGGPGNDGRGGREMGEYELERRAGVEGRKGNFWGRVKRVVGGREGPVGLRRAEVRFLLE